MCQKLPYLPPNRNIEYVLAENPWMMEAKKCALAYSKDKNQPTGCALVQNGQIVGRGANGSWVHDIFGCLRKILGISTGKGYWMCAGCSPRCHAEARAIKNAGASAQNAELYLWGHWWCCKSCWEKIIKAKVGQVYLEKN